MLVRGYKSEKKSVGKLTVCKVGYRELKSMTVLSPVSEEEIGDKSIRLVPIE